MASLPIVNDFSSNQKTDRTVQIEKISESLKKRMDSSSLSGLFVSSSNDETQETAVNELKSVSIAKRIYAFFLNDSIRNDQLQRIEDREKDKEENKRADEDIEYLTAIAENKKESKDDKEEGFISKLMGYAKSISFGMSVYRNWSRIEKLLGIEGIGESIKKIADDFGITKIIDEIKITIDSIIGDFKLGRIETDIPVVTGPSSINKADPSKVLRAMKFFISKGLTPEQSAGIVGNMLQENPAFALDIGGDHGTAGGLFQHRGARQKGMGSTFDEQLQHAWDEMTGKSPTKDPRSEQALKRILESKTGVEVPTIAFSEDFERPGTPMIENRIRYARGALELYNQPNESPSVSTDTTPIPQKESAPVSAPPKPKTFSESIKPKTDPFASLRSSSDPIKSTFRSTGMVDTKPSTDLYTRVPKKTETPQTKDHSEQGELGGESVGQPISSVESQTLSGVSSENDLNGLNFVNHGSANPLSTEKQITRLQSSKLQQLKQVLGMSSLKIISGTRTPEHNKSVGGAERSEHLNGRATDIDTSGMTDEQRVAFVKAATKVGFGGVGIYGSFIHLDTGKVRVWKKTSISPAMSEALDQHQQGRAGQTIDVSTPIQPSLSEGGELGAGQSTAQRQSRKKTAIESIQEEMQGFFDMFDQLPQVIKNLEDKVMEYSKEIPRKEKVAPLIPPMMNQTNFMLNMNEEKKYYVTDDNVPSNLSDIPPIFANEFLTQYK